MLKTKTLAYFQSGGPTAVINSSLLGVITEAKKHQEIGDIIGAKYGVEGLIDNDFVDLRKVDDDELQLLKQTPGAALGSSRHKVSEEKGDYKAIIKTIEARNIGYLLVNGGNDSMDTCFKLAELSRKHGNEIKVIGIPKTIDNDLALTDHSIGFPSAARHVMNMVKMVVLDAAAYKEGKVVIVEIMGRNAGWLTASTDLLGEKERPDLIYLPESDFDEVAFLNEVKEVYEKKRYCVVALSEGIPVRHEFLTKKDPFGHVSLEGVSSSLAKLIKEKLGIGVRSMELSTPERADPAFVSRIDQEEAFAAGATAVLEALKGESEKMISIRRNSNEPYSSSFELVNLDKVANAVKLFPKEWITSPKGFSQEFKDYLKPLCSDGIEVTLDPNGVIASCHLK